MILAIASNPLDSFHGMSLTLLVAGILASGAWLLLLLWRWWLSFPRMPTAGPATSDLGPEPPAVVNLLVNRWHPTRAAIAATVLDLAARRSLGVEQYGDEFVVRLRDARPQGDPPTDYEQQVLRLVQSRATGGSAPVSALALGEEAAAQAWWKRFSSAVVKDARKRGLAQGRWARRDWVILGSGLALVMLLFALAFGEAGIGHTTRTTSSRSNISRTDWLWIGGFAWLGVMVLLQKMQDLRGTETGEAACSRWLGVRDYFRGGHAFDHAPAAAVVLWDRNLAYGAALGIAHEAVHDLPFHAEDPGSAWSRYGGDWHELRIHYPTRFGACQSPGRVIWAGFWQAAFWGGLAFIALPIVFEGALSILASFRKSGGQLSRGEQELVLGAAAAFTAVGAVLAFRAAGGAIRLGRGLLDLGAPGSVTGEVVKVHAGRVAVDDGKSPVAVAWIPPVKAPPLAVGATVRARITHHLHYVREVTVLAQSSRPPLEEQAAPAAAGIASAFAPAAPLPDLGSLVATVTGLTLAPVGGEAGIPGQAYADASGNAVAVGRMHVGAMLQNVMLRGVAKAGEEHAIAGVGESAWWFKDEQLMARAGGDLVMVRVHLPGRTPDERLAMAKSLAQAALGSPATAQASQSAPAEA